MDVEDNIRPPLMKVRKAASSWQTSRPARGWGPSALPWSFSGVRCLLAFQSILTD